MTDGQVWFRKRAYLQRVTSDIQRNNKVNSHTVRKVVDRWCSGKEQTIVGSDGQRNLWWHLNVGELIAIARVEGLDYTAIEQLEQGAMKLEATQ